MNMINHYQPWLMITVLNNYISAIVKWILAIIFTPGIFTGGHETCWAVRIGVRGVAGEERPWVTSFKKPGPGDRKISLETMVDVGNSH